MAEPKFTVDTHLFRELGQLLVGRDSTALVELIKNSYDADAHKVIVDGQNLSNGRSGRITITDDGIGMGLEAFNQGFLRIASRIKDDGERKSVRYKRRYTGAKGIGRLAAHKLARFIHIYSIPDEEVMNEDIRPVDASIDWDLVEEKQTLDELPGSGAITVKTEKRQPNTTSGTIIELQRLRRKWTPTERARFFAEVPYRRCCYLVGQIRRCMLTYTFQHMRGIGPKKERELWRSGVKSWDEFVLRAKSQLLMFNILKKRTARAPSTNPSEPWKQRMLISSHIVYLGRNTIE